MLGFALIHQPLRPINYETKHHRTHTAMLTKNTTELRVLVQKHVAADQVVQGTYWNSENQRGCFIGCLNHSSDPLGAENKFGLPIMVQRIAESIFEALPPCEAKAFFAALPEAVGCDGKDLSRVGWQFLAAELRSLPKQVARVRAVIDPVIAGMELLAAGQEWPAWDAARAAEARAAEAAEVAAEAAARAAWAAARAARAARAAAIQRQRELLLRLIAEAPVREIESVGVMPCAGLDRPIKGVAPCSPTKNHDQTSRSLTQR